MVQAFNHPSCFARLQNCEFPATLAPDDAIAGLGIFAVFVVNAALCLAGTYIVVWARFANKIRSSCSESRKQKDTGIWIAANGIGDVQLFAGIAVSLSAYILLRNGTVTAYHYDLACYLGVSATFTALTTVFAWPDLHAHLTATCARLVALIFSTVLLALLLAPVSAAGTTYPGRAPVGTSGPGSALVLEAKCFLKQHIPNDCRFSTDRSPYAPLTGAWVLIPIGLVFLVGLSTKYDEARDLLRRAREQFSTENKKPQQASPEPERNDGDAPGCMKKTKVHVGAMLLQLSAITIASMWAIAALWQYYQLRQYMNNSGWLSNPAEVVVASFSQLVPIIQVFSTLLLLACACDKWRKADRDAKEKKKMVQQDEKVLPSTQTAPTDVV